jgi:hypothetical protein
MNASSSDDNIRPVFEEITPLKTGFPLKTDMMPEGNKHP